MAKRTSRRTKRRGYACKGPARLHSRNVVKVRLDADNRIGVRPKNFSVLESIALNVTLTLLSSSCMLELEPLWRGLESRADASFFQSWLWIGTWLESLPPRVEAMLLRVDRGDEVLALGILVRRRLTRYGILRSRGLFLNCTGEPQLDEITIEYNGLLCARGEEHPAMRACTHFLFRGARDCDELYLDGLHRPQELDSLVLIGTRVRRRRQRNFHFVNLGRLRGDGHNFLGTLGAKTRHNIRRSIREYEKRGPLGLHEAQSAPQAHAYMSRLRHFHRQYWELKGQPGSFSNDFFTRFHERLIDRIFAEHAVQLLRITAGDTEVGYLYNFLYRGRVYNYQGGFNYSVNATQNRPGLICHTYAVQHNLEQGAAIYDFMAGDVEP